MNTQVTKKTKITCRLRRWMMSFQSEDDLLTKAEHNRHVCRCSECQQYYKLWQELESELHEDLPEHDKFECDQIMTQIRNGESAAVEKTKEPALGWLVPGGSRSWLWLAAGCSIVLVLIVTFWNQNSDLKTDGMAESASRSVEQKTQDSEKKLDKPSNGDHPLMMLAALQKEQGLIASDIAKFKTLLDKQVIIFHEE